MKLEVSIVQRRLPHYRVPLFLQLRTSLAAHDINLRLLHGMPTEEERKKNDSGEIEWAEILPTRYFLGGKILWQPFLKKVKGSHLVILSQENKHLHNIPVFLNPFRKQRFAFFAHGRNLQASKSDCTSERFKRWTTNRVDWWFAYTDLTATLVQADGFPASRITVVNNSIDTSALAELCNQCQLTPKSHLREGLGLNPSAPTAVFIGSLTPEKRIDVLLASAKALHQRIPGFQLAIGGDGAMRPLVEAIVAKTSYIKWYGAVTGLQKARLLKCADMMLQPGALGLGILDAFVAGLPLITLQDSKHGPEISYLKNAQNALMAKDESELLDKIVALFEDPGYLKAIATGAQKSSVQFSIDRTVENFVSGIISACGSSVRKKSSDSSYAT